MALPGDILSYTITAKNTGEMNAVPATVVDTLPAHTVLDQTSLGTGGFIYNPLTNTLSWSGNLIVGQTKVLSYKVKLDSNIELFRPPANKAENQTTISGGAAEWLMSSTVMMNVPVDPTCVGPACGGVNIGQPPYITEQINPELGAHSVKLYQPLLVPFSKVMDPGSIKYEVWIGNRQIDTSQWVSTWDDDGTDLTLTPDKPWESGETYKIHVVDAVDTEGLALITDGPVYNNEWSFTTVRPALYFSSPEGAVSLVAGAVAGPVTIKIGDWTNFDQRDTPAPRQYEPYKIEKTDLILNLESTSATGRFGQTSTGEFYTKEYGPWYSNPPEADKYLRISVGQDEVNFYYTDAVLGYNSVTSSDLSQGYVVVDTPSKPVIVTDTGVGAEDQIYFGSDPQSIPVNYFSNPIMFGVMNQQDNIWLKEGRMFLLSSTSPAGRFFTGDKHLIDDAVTFETNQGPQTYYRYYIQTECLSDTIYYKDTVPGTYTITIADGRELGIATVSELQIAAEYSDRVAKSAGQSMHILPLKTQEYDELVQELQEVKDNTGRVLARIDINPKDVTVLPGGVKLFTAKGYDTEGKEIDELVFSWYILAGGGTIMKSGLGDDSHTSRFTAGMLPGVYYDTVMVAAYYNGGIVADTATVRVARVVNYGAPGQLPSTGPVNGIQLIFMILTLLSAVALAAVEHYEKTCLAKTSKNSPA